MKNHLHLAIARAEFEQQIRNFFKKRDFVEVQTPIMVKTPGMEPHLNVFETKFYDKNCPRRTPAATGGGKSAEGGPRYLNHSPELQMKKLLGHKNPFDKTDHFEKIFQITKVFRNGEIGGPLHSPEFTMLEWYRKNADYKTLMTDCENLITTLQTTLNFKSEFSMQPAARTLQQSPWPRISTQELFQKHTGTSLLKNRTYKQLKKAAKKLDLPIKSCKTWDDIFFTIFLNKIEPNLPKTPIFITDYPASQAALARLKSNEPFFAERFELYINGIELCNAFSELTDPKEQRKRLIKEQRQRKKMGKTVFPIDEDFLKALKNLHTSKTTAAGCAFGLDRLLMVLINKQNIEDVLFFPL
ncbi:EF-P lysine aminoacylase GenX [Candidatus Peregrinibacteria bacterium]|nr:EF-P lysine aminoacylase GenX [Candidatus Peregrinibacteria bacterium]